MTHLSTIRTQYQSTGSEKVNRNVIGYTLTTGTRLFSKPFELFTRDQFEDSSVQVKGKQFL